jgi:hypothetical protein
VTGDVFLRRLESTAVIACAAMAVIALALTRGQPDFAAGVLGGGFLIGFSYWTIGSGLSALGMTATPSRHTTRQPPRVGRTMLTVFVRYALLALLAYVMIARLRLHPLGLLAGASSVVVAASIEAFRLLLKKS